MKCPSQPISGPPRHPSQIGPLKPAPALLPPAPTPALANATLDASGSVCYSGPCSYAFELVCRNASTVTKNGTSPTAIITTGKGATGYDVNMLNVPAGTTCNATVVVTDSNTGTTATAAAILQVEILLCVGGCFESLVCFGPSAGERLAPSV